LTIIWVVVWVVVRFVQGTRAAGALKGILVMFVVVLVATQILGTGGILPRLSFIYDRVLALVALGLVVIFQPELRRAAIRVGEASIFRSTPSEIAQVADAVTDACAYLSKAQFGAIVVIERQVGLRGLIEGGTKLNAALSSQMLQTIFFPGTALHDLAVVIRGVVIDSAGVQLPMADPTDVLDPSFGARHRAAVGVTKECDALVVVVSEETGLIRLAEWGKLSDPLTPQALRAELVRRMSAQTPVKRRRRSDAGDNHEPDEPSREGT
jgi:diadenylate cyclase